MLEGAFRNRRVLITGHTGFKGSWLALWLHDLGAQITGLALPPASSPSHFELLGLDSLVEHVIGDITEFSTVEAAICRSRPEAVIHLAAQALVRDSYDDPLTTIRTNVLGTAHLLEAIRRSDSVKAVLVVTSDKCYENKDWSWGYRESDPLGGSDPYSASKGAAEIICSGLWRSFFRGSGRGPHLGLATARAGNVIGGGDWARDRLIPDCVRAAQRGQPVRLRNPASERPWQHVLDALLGYLYVLRGLLADPERYSGAWNFGPSPTDRLTVLEVTRSFFSSLGIGSIELGEPDETRRESGRLRLAIDKALCELQWQPTLTSRTAIGWTASWYRGWLEDPGRALERSLGQIRDFCKQASLSKETGSNQT